ncbi:hypothetical protein L3V83_13260 [Thiotrichales bacterium 19X7-9]|nr:hypothetical protein [Thiotrichales bacterium 19X7-9]
MIKLETPHQRLKATRIARNYNEAKDFCNSHSDIKYRTYLKHESGVIPLSKKAAEKYAVYLNIPVDYLLSGDSLNKKHTYNKSLRKRALEPIVLSKLIQSVFAIIDSEYNESYFSKSCLQPNINYDNLMKHIYISCNEIIEKIENVDEMDTIVNSIACLNRNTFFNCVSK